MPSAEHEAVVAAIQSQPLGDAPNSIEEMRAGMQERVGYFQALEFPDGVEEVPFEGGGVSGCWFTPPAPHADDAILYLHGGGYVGWATVQSNRVVHCSLDLTLERKHALCLAAVEDLTSTKAG